MPKVVLVLPTDNSFYRRLALDIRTNCSESGIDVDARHFFSTDRSLSQYLDEIQPDVVIDMNRTWESRSVRFPASRYVGWMVDMGQIPYSTLNSSSKLAFWGFNWYSKFKSNYGAKNSIWLPPGASPGNVNLNIRQREIDSFFFCGHLSEDFTGSEKRRVLPTTRDGETRTFEDVISAASNALERESCNGYDNEDYVKLFLKESGLDAYDAYSKIAEDSKLLYDIGCRIVRVHNRRRLIEWARRSGYKLRVAGPEKWKDVVDERIEYIGFIESTEAMANNYRQSLATLHEGVGMHFRSLESMACGGLVINLKGADEENECGLASFFEEGIEFIEISGWGDMTNKQKNLLRTWHGSRNQESLVKKINEQHTWGSRFARVLEWVC